MRDLDCASAVPQGNGERVVAYDTDRRELCGGGQRPVARGGQQQVAIHLVFAFKHAGLTGAGERPELAALP